MKDKEQGADQSGLGIPDKLYFKIGEVSDIVGVEPYVLRYWESEFNLVKPSRTKSRQRLYIRKDLESILEIKNLLYNEKFTIAGAKKKLRKSNSQEDREAKFTLSGEGYRELLDDIKNELKVIRDILE